MRALIAYYSRRGQNIVNGTVQTLKMGNTELVVAILQKFTGYECFRIEPYEDYPEDYYQCIDFARQDLIKGVRPKMKNCLSDIDCYDVIYLGYPNYWGTMPAVVFSFLEQFDFTGKTIKPFCTHENGGMGHSEEDLKRVCPTARVESGLPIQGSKIRYELSAIENWACNEQKEENINGKIKL